MGKGATGRNSGKRLSGVSLRAILILTKLRMRMLPMMFVSCQPQKLLDCWSRKHIWMDFNSYCPSSWGQAATILGDPSAPAWRFLGTKPQGKFCANWKLNKETPLLTWSLHHHHGALTLCYFDSRLMTLSQLGGRWQKWFAAAIALACNLIMPYCRVT